MLTVQLTPQDSTQDIETMKYDRHEGSTNNINKAVTEGKTARSLKEK